MKFWPYAVGSFVAYPACVIMLHSWVWALPCVGISFGALVLLRRVVVGSWG